MEQTINEDLRENNYDLTIPYPLGNKKGWSIDLCYNMDLKYEPQNKVKQKKLDSKDHKFYDYICMNCQE